MSFSNMIPLLVLFALLQITSVFSNAEESQTYIVHMDHSQKPSSFCTHESWHRSILTSLVSSSSLADEENEMLLYSYNYVMHGFSARLIPSQLAKLEESPAHVATYPETFGKLFTTHSSKFLGLRPNSGLLHASSSGKDVIIGIIDTGVWPESKSFSDGGMSQVPKRWRGTCENGTNFSPSLCNNKLIGARSFCKGMKAAGIKISSKDDFESPRDWFGHGHGTHTSSTAAGNHVHFASHFGYAKGTARGVAPRAHVAMYKIMCENDADESFASDVLAGMDQAISDGVDIMSLSFGLEELNIPYFNDVIAIASLSAVEHGIVVVCAAGNGEGYNSTHNSAPWIITVGAGTLDRTFTATMTLDNGATVEGTSYFPESVYITDAPLYYGKENASKAGCSGGALDEKDVTGKVVLCDPDEYALSQLEEVERAGAYAGIFMTQTQFDPEFFSIPAVIVPLPTGDLLRQYATQTNTTRVKTMSFMHTNLGTKHSPEVANFSNRGPDPINPGILKPDVIAPGVNVLAAVIPNKRYMEVNNYNLVTEYGLDSGTSMAAPHVAGAAALLKAVHKEWSPAAIRSAIMTTAYSIDNSHNSIQDQSSGLPATPLDFGAGHINPNRAMNPGLVYDMNVQDYIEFLCSLGYNDKQMRAVTRRSQWSCRHSPAELNYPSFMAIFNKTDSLRAKKFSRVVTNVGNDTSIYLSAIEVPSGMRITVEPDTMTFTAKNQQQGFVMTVEIDSDVPKVIYGSLSWVDQHGHIVSSPVVALSN